MRMCHVPVVFSLVAGVAGSLGCRCGTTTSSRAGPAAPPWLDSAMVVGADAVFMMPAGATSEPVAAVFARIKRSVAEGATGACPRIEFFVEAEACEKCVITSEYTGPNTVNLALLTLTLRDALNKICPALALEWEAYGDSVLIRRRRSDRGMLEATFWEP